MEKSKSFEQAETGKLTLFRKWIGKNWHFLEDVTSFRFKLQQNQAKKQVPVC